jgi:hypothetical protein
MQKIIIPCDKSGNPFSVVRILWLYTQDPDKTGFFGEKAILGSVKELL